MRDLTRTTSVEKHKYKKKPVKPRNRPMTDEEVKEYKRKIPQKTEVV